MHVYRCYFLSQHRTHLALEVIRCGGDGEPLRAAAKMIHERRA